MKEKVKKVFETPVIEVIVCLAADIIMTSPGGGDIVLPPDVF